VPRDDRLARRPLTIYQMPQETFVIGDVHGSAKELKRLVEQLPLDADSTLVFLGDYVDRGPDSRGVIDFILTLREHMRVITLEGNHEQMFLDFLNEPNSSGAGMFIYNGGSSTLASYADDEGNYAIPDAHTAFLRDLDLYYEDHDVFCVHAGVPDIPLGALDAAEHRMTMLWIRDRFLRSTYQWSKVVVHGHSRVRDAEIKNNRINLDTACAYGGKLTAMQISTHRVFSEPHDAEAKRVYLRDVKSQRAAIRFEGTLLVTVHHGSQTLTCETVNFSEIGMLMRDTSRRDRLILQQGEIINGTVGAEHRAKVTFRGRVVRHKLNPDGGYYAIQIISDIRAP